MHIAHKQNEGTAPKKSPLMEDFFYHVCLARLDHYMIYHIFLLILLVQRFSQTHSQGLTEFVPAIFF